MENMFFCELFSFIWFCFERRPRGLVYSSVYHLRNQKYNSDLQFQCVIRYTDKRFLGLLCVFMSILTVRGRLRCLTGCHTVCPSFDVLGTNVGGTGSLLQLMNVMRVIFSIHFYHSVHYTELTEIPQTHCVQNYRDTTGNNNCNTLYDVGLADGFV